MKRPAEGCVRTAAQWVFCSLTAGDSKRALVSEQHAGVKVRFSSFTRFLLITKFSDGVRGADDGIKPGVERSETPGDRREKNPKPAERTTVESSTNDVFVIATSIGRFADCATFCVDILGFRYAHPRLYAIVRSAD